MSKKIYINPGHSVKDPGAVGYETERELNVKVSKYMNDYLVKNYECETKVTGDNILKTSAVARDANAWKADLFVSNHFNAGGGDGYEALVVADNRKGLGEVFNKHVKAIGQNSRGVKIRPNLVVLKATNMPAVLNEGAFVDNKKDITDWNDDNALKKMGEAYAKAAAEYLDLPKKINEPEVKPEPETEIKPVPENKPEVKPAEKVEESKSYRVKVTASALNVRKGPGMSYGISTVIRDNGVYTIVSESNDYWGKLKSGAGWINLKYTKKI
jgi:N-acetylmuramoyl-L-alanine amidase